MHVHGYAVKSKLVPIMFTVVCEKSNIQLQLESVVHIVSIMLRLA